MASLTPRLLLLTLLVGSLLPIAGHAEETGLLDKEEEEAVTFTPSSVEPDDFDTDVDPLHEEALQGFNCMDKTGDGYLTMEELDHRGDCVENAVERGMDTETRTALILTRMDADRDRKVSRREFNIWSDMQIQ